MTSIKQNLKPVIDSLLDRIKRAGFIFRNMETDGEYRARVPKLQSSMVKIIHEGLMTDIGLTGPDGDATLWVRVIMDNDPCAIVNDYSVHDALEVVVTSHSDAWEHVVWTPHPVSKEEYAQF